MPRSLWEGCRDWGLGDESEEGGLVEEEDWAAWMQTIAGNRGREIEVCAFGRGMRA
jgi:hypothetical protein